MTFCIVPQSVGTFEALYNFIIVNHDVQMQFLFVANVREPNIHFFNSHLQLKATVLGISVVDFIVLRNDESESIAYKFKNSSLFSEARRQRLTVEPRRGVLEKKSETKIK